MMTLVFFLKMQYQYQEEILQRAVSISEIREIPGRTDTCKNRRWHITCLVLLLCWYVECGTIFLCEIIICVVLPLAGCNFHIFQHHFLYVFLSVEHLSVVHIQLDLPLLPSRFRLFYYIIWYNHQTQHQAFVLGHIREIFLPHKPFWSLISWESFENWQVP